MWCFLKDHTYLTNPASESCGFKFKRGPSIKYVSRISRKTNISNPPMPTRTYQGFKNISFSENFAYVLNG